MKRWIFIIVLLPFFFDSMAKKREAVVVPDSVSVTLTPDSIILTEKKEDKLDKKVSRDIVSWKYKGALTEKETAGLDTSMVEFYINNPAQKQTIALQTLGNLGSPAQSAIFMDRVGKTDFVFFKPFQIYYKPSEDILFFNTKRPFSYLNYYGGGTHNRDNRRLDGLFSVNVNKKMNFGLYGDWTKAYGCYNSLSTKNYGAGFFASYDGVHQQFGTSISFNGFESYENGGFTNDRNITDPKNTGRMDPMNIPTFFSDNDWTKVRNWNVAFNYRYNIGLEKEVEVKPDSFTVEVIPITSIIYNFSSESDWRRFYERNLVSVGLMVDSFYHRYNLSDSLYYNKISTSDSTRFWKMKHTVGISLNEEYNTLMKFGFAAYASITTKKYTYLDKALTTGSGEITPHNDSLGFRYNPAYSSILRHRFGVGAVLSKHLGEAFTYNFYGEYYFLDEKKTASTFEVGGTMNSKANWGKQLVQIGASAKFERYCPDFFEEYYYSNHIEWQEDFENKQDLSINGYLSFPTFAFYDGLGLDFTADFKNLNNYIFWNEKAKPEQYTENLQVLTFALKERARIWRVHWDNALAFQQTSNDKVLPLPQLSWYSSAYFRFDKLFKVLNIQLGVDMRWNSAYYAPNYMPATGQFFVQDPNSIDYQKYGDYVYMDAFINFHLKRVRFYVEFNHLNKLWTNHYNYLYMRGYAMDPSYLKFGLSATLAD